MKRSSFLVAGLLALATVASLALPACSSSPRYTPTPATTVSPTGTVSPAPISRNVTINLVAQNLAFNTSTITVPAGASVTMNFDNKDPVPHNFSLFANSSATPPGLFQGQIITRASIVYKFTAPTTPGTYFFRCDVHPTQMTGSFVVTP